MVIAWGWEKFGRMIIFPSVSEVSLNQRAQACTDEESDAPAQLVSPNATSRRVLRAGAALFAIEHGLVARSG